MLSKLAKIANRLDSIGLTREADTLDSFMRKIAGGGWCGRGKTEAESLVVALEASP